MSHIRHLDPSEAYHACVDWSGSYSVAYSGNIDTGIFLKAFDVLATTVPLLRARLGRDARGFYFAATADQRAETVVVAGDEAAYLEQMGRPLDSAQGLCRLVLVTGEQGGHVILMLHHTIVDGRAGLALLDRLWRDYTALCQGETLQAEEPSGPPASAERLLGARGAEPSADLMRRRDTFSAVLATAPQPPKLPLVPDRIRLDRAATAELVGALRAEGLSVHAYVSGVATVALRAELGGDPGPREMVCGCPVDLRSRVSPPVPLEGSTNFVSGVEARVLVAADADPKQVGSEVKARLDLAIASGEAEAAILDPDRFAVEEQVPVDLVVTNLGPIPEFTAPEGVRVTDFRGFTTTTMPALLLFVVTSYGGRLSMEFTSPAGHLDAAQRARLVERTSALLHAVPAARG
jgi:hypothetical protein